MLAAISIVPLGSGESVGAQVAEAVRIIRDSGLPSETNAMFTNVEGEWDEIMPVIRACLDKISQAAPRVTVFLKLDLRSGSPWAGSNATWSRSSAGSAEGSETRAPSRVVVRRSTFETGPVA